MDFRILAIFSISCGFHVALSLRCARRENSGRYTCFHQRPADFKSSEENCIAMGGKLQMGWDDAVAALLLNENGHFWIGAQYTCSGPKVRGDIARSVNEMKDKTCSLQCMSVSSGSSQTERPCEERMNGFICQDVPWESCWAENALEVIMLNKENCALAPCEHRCKDAPGGVGYVCYCETGFKMSIKGPQYCAYACSSSSCEANCRKCSEECTSGHTSCYCPDGFIKDEKQCIDIDECTFNHDCEQNCTNTIGSYRCSCSQDYKLVNRSVCIPRLGDPVIADVLRPSMNYTSQAAFSAPVHYVGLTLFILLAVFGVIVLLYYLRKRKSNVNPNTYDSTSQEKL